MILCDTGPLVAATMPDDQHYHRCAEFFTGVRLAAQEILVPATVVAEVGYLLAARSGAHVEHLFLQAIAEGDFVPVELTVADYARMAELVEQYANLPLGTTDASVIALAERLDLDEVATLDHRHFTVVRPKHVRALTLLP